MTANTKDTGFSYKHKLELNSPGLILIPLNLKSKLPKKWGKYIWGDNPHIKIENPTDHRLKIQNDILTYKVGGTPTIKFGTNANAGWMAYAWDGLLSNDLNIILSIKYEEQMGFTVNVYSDKTRVELEPVSPPAKLKPDEEYTFTEHWWLLDYPAAKSFLKLAFGF